MVKWILILLLLLAVVYGGSLLYTNHRQAAQAYTGDVTCLGGCDSPEAHARFLKENSGDTPDGDSERKQNTARVAAERAEEGYSSDYGASSPAPSGASTMVAPGDSMDLPQSASTPAMLPNSGQRAALPSGLPTHDSEPPNAPNGMRFAGSGIYQWYRQGNLTFRIDTSTGRSCIIYATKKLWRDPLVYSNGCGSTT
jgi:hypothetical protein